MITVTGLDHVVLRTANVAAMIKFYGEVLGCRIERVSQELGLTQMRAGAALIDLVDTDGEIGRQGGAPTGAEGRNMDHFCLKIAGFDVATVAAHLARHGIETGEPARRYGATGFAQTLYIEDPEGNMVELRGVGEEVISSASARTT